MHEDEIVDGILVTGELQSFFHNSARMQHMAGCCDKHGEDASIYAANMDVAEDVLMKSLPPLMLFKAIDALSGYRPFAAAHRENSQMCRHVNAMEDAHLDPDWPRSGLAADLVAVLRS